MIPWAIGVWARHRIWRIALFHLALLRRQTLWRHFRHCVRRHRAYPGSDTLLNGPGF